MAQGGGEAARAKHTARGKLPPRERVEMLLDPDTPFLELSPLAALDIYDNAAPGAGIITGIGRVCRRRMRDRLQRRHRQGRHLLPADRQEAPARAGGRPQNRLPCIYLVDSGGANLPNQDEVFPDRDHFGRIFYNQANLSAQGIPQIAVVMGSCTAGGAYVPAMSDESHHRAQPGHHLPGRPAAGEGRHRRGGERRRPGRRRRAHAAVGRGRPPGRERPARAGAGAQRGGQPELAQARPAAAAAAAAAAVRRARALRRDPGRPAQALRRARDHRPHRRRQRVRRVQGALRHHAGDGFAHIEGMPVGIVANNGILFGESAQKGAHFIELCCQRKVPLVFLQNITGFMVGRKYENEGIAKHGAKMVTAVATATVPKFTVIIGGSFGAGNYGMCGRAYSPRFLWMWPNARISVMGGEQAASVLATVQARRHRGQGRHLVRRRGAAFKQPILDQFAHQAHPYYASARLWDDGVIDPADTRRVLALGLSASLNAPIPDRPRFGVFRM
jgi:3-methylcrotonyl-CoA carboxylase beta subunit